MRKVTLKKLIFCILAIIFVIGIYKQEVFATSQSKDNSLGSLSISPGTLTPEFYPSTTRYTANVPGDTTSIEVTALPNHPAARVVSITGADNLEVGENIILIEVEAQDSTPVTYQITVTREEPIETEQTEERTQEVSNVNESRSSSDRDEVPQDKEASVEDKQDPISGGQLDKLRSDLINLQDKYDKDIKVLFVIILVLALVGSGLLILLLGTVSRNRRLIEEIRNLQLQDGLIKKREVKKTSNKEKQADIEGEYYFEEIDD